MFCRFGVRTGGAEKVACLTPIASHLLQPHHRWRGCKFSNTCSPLVLDFTPAVLGPSEGFSQAGFDVQAAIGFDQDRHLTWKVRMGYQSVCSMLNTDTSRYDITQVIPMTVPPSKSSTASGPHTYSLRQRYDRRLRKWHQSLV
jgi:hypothetical protein